MYYEFFFLRQVEPFLFLYLSMAASEEHLESLWAESSGPNQIYFSSS
jgi:hypothetical protein